MDTTGYEEEAVRLHGLGYNCAQCVLMACAGPIGTDRRTAALAGAGLGAGMAMGEVCGAASALAVAEGFRSGDESPAGKRKAMPCVKAMCTEFARPFGGKITCRDLKGKCGESCDGLIRRGVRVLLESHGLS